MRLREIVVIELKEEKQWGREWWKSLSEMKKWKFENGVKVNEKLMVCYVENMLEKGGNRKRSISEMYWVYMKG